MNYTEFLLLLSVLPSIIIGIIIYKKDIIEKEPKSLLVKLFLCGAIGSVILTLIITKIIDPFLPDLAENEVNLTYLAITTFFKIALVEEFSKWIFLKKLTWKNKEFNYIYDAIVYAVFVALGFATLENILYVFNDDGGLSVAILRAIVSVPGHAFDGAFMGYYYGIAKQAQINNNNNLFRKNIILSLLVPTILHFIFDYLILADIDILLIFYLIFIVLLYINAFKKISQLSKIAQSLYGKTENTNQQNNNTIIAKYCSNCGKPVNGNFCSNCGQKIN